MSIESKKEAAWIKYARSDARQTSGEKDVFKAGFAAGFAACRATLIAMKARKRK